MMRDGTFVLGADVGIFDVLQHVSQSGGSSTNASTQKSSVYFPKAEFWHPSLTQIPDESQVGCGSRRLQLSGSKAGDMTSSARQRLL